VTNYSVGYGKPPKEQQFKSTKTSKPKNQKKAKSKSPDLEKILNATVSVKKQGRPAKVSTDEAAFYAVLKDAMEGKISAIAYLLSLAQQNGLLFVHRQELSPVIDIPRDIPGDAVNMLLKEKGRPPWKEKDINACCKELKIGRFPEWWVSLYGEQPRHG